MSENCPTCDKPFDKTASMKKHHALSHGESIAGVLYPCDNCGDEIRVPPKEAESQSNFCDRECKYRWHSEVLFSGENNSSWGGGKVERACENCGGPVRRYPSQFVGTESVFCGDGCMGEHYHETGPKGEDHPVWKGGYEPYYGPTWTVKRERVRRRDGNVCRRCGAGEDELSRVPAVHHIKPVREFDDPTEAHTMDNMVQLCDSCHGTVEAMERSEQREAFL